jgi:hypothetical protein
VAGRAALLLPTRQYSLTTAQPQRQRYRFGERGPRPGEEGTQDIQTGSLEHSPTVPNVFPFLGWCKPKHYGSSAPQRSLTRVSGRNHKETWAGCIVSLTTFTSSSLRACRSVSSRSFAEKASRVLAASYFLR